MSGRDTFDAAVKGMGVREHLDICVRSGRGSRGLYYAQTGQEGVLRAKEWQSLRDGALDASRLVVNPVDLDGRMLGNAFVQHVLRAPSVQAAGHWLRLERPLFGDVFVDGRFPTCPPPRRTRRANLPSRANVGTRKFWTVPVGEMPREMVQRDQPSYASPERSWNHRWPVVLAAADLTAAFNSQYEQGVAYRHDPTEGPPYHAGKALADRSEAFFDLLRTGQVIATGTSTKTHESVLISGEQWHRADKWIDVESNDVLFRESDTFEVWWSGVKLQSRQTVSGSVLLVSPDRLPTKSAKRRSISPVADAVAHCLKELGVDHNRGGRSHDALAQTIAPCVSGRVGKPYRSASELTALKQAIIRYYKQKT
jgi:hypothetical protein